MSTLKKFLIRFLHYESCLGFFSFVFCWFGVFFQMECMHSQVISVVAYFLMHNWDAGCHWNLTLQVWMVLVS